MGSSVNPWVIENIYLPSDWTLVTVRWNRSVKWSLCPCKDVRAWDGRAQLWCSASFHLLNYLKSFLFAVFCISALTMIAWALKSNMVLIWCCSHHSLPSWRQTILLCNAMEWKRLEYFETHQRHGHGGKLLKKNEILETRVMSPMLPLFQN